MQRIKIWMGPLLYLFLGVLVALSYNDLTHNTVHSSPTGWIKAISAIIVWPVVIAMHKLHFTL